MEILIGIAVLAIVVGVGFHLFAGKKNTVEEREPRPNESMDKLPPMSDGWGGGDSGS
ncbi:hypothetical protein [Staphylospora marina]|uniref:hypothetical protein n=1 Tax=Staphylospora marina TaxID=2490858 RepID=UPI0013DD9375|nr:hypothetical protein [Staphylospora marina]